MNRRHLRFLTIPTLALVLLFQLGFDSCKNADGTKITTGEAIARGIRLALVASPAFLGSLGLSNSKQAIASDFLTLGNDGLVFETEMKACADNPCRVNAVDHFQTKFWDVLRGGHFKLSPKLERVQKIVQGLIDSARIFFGGPPPASMTPAANGPARVITESDLKAQIEELKVAMKPN